MTIIAKFFTEILSATQCIAFQVAKVAILTRRASGQNQFQLEDLLYP